MTMVSLRAGRAGGRTARRGYVLVWAAATALAAAAIGVVCYLLWPTFANSTLRAPGELPISIGNTLFNVPAPAIRRSVQRRSGPQERIDLSFAYPSLAPPGAPKHISAGTISEESQPIDVIFLSIAAHHDALAPEERARTIYPRYLEPAAPGSVTDGLSVRAFRAGTPYAGEDLVAAGNPNLLARCTRDGATPGMCLSERRIEDADLVFRFPRDWLTRWREVANSLDRLADKLHAHHR